jgi:mRNA interferase RelE/StbE
MNRYTVVLSSHPAGYCRKSDKKTQDILKKTFLCLEENPYYHPGGRIRRIAGHDNLYRFRIGSLRIVYEVLEIKKEIVVLLIGPRGDIYKKI